MSMYNSKELAFLCEAIETIQIGIKVAFYRSVWYV